MLGQVDIGYIDQKGIRVSHTHTNIAEYSKPSIAKSILPSKFIFHCAPPLNTHKTLS